MTSNFFEPTPSEVKHAGVMVLHGGAGITEHERDRARMLAALGYVAFVPDLFRVTFRDRAHGVEVITALVADSSALRARLLDELARLRAHARVDASRVAAIGFCFGGLAALELARSGADIRAAVSFHGGLTTNAPAIRNEVRASVLVCTGLADPFVTREHRIRFEDEMIAADVDFQMHHYARAMHGFTERGLDRLGTRYDENADLRSWSALRELFDTTLR
jgi:dienelactone hydrolase